MFDERVESVQPYIEKKMEWLIGVGAAGGISVFFVFFLGGKRGDVPLLPVLQHDVETVLEWIRRCVAHCARERWLAE